MFCLFCLPFRFELYGNLKLHQTLEAKNIFNRLSSNPFLEAPGNCRARLAVLYSIPDGSFKTFESYTVKFSAKETKWTSLEVNTS